MIDLKKVTDLKKVIDLKKIKYLLIAAASVLLISCTVTSRAIYLYKNHLVKINKQVKYIENTYKNKLEELLKENTELMDKVNELEKPAQKWKLFEERYEKSSRADVERQITEETNVAFKRMRVTAYTEYECDKDPDHPAFRITTSGNEVEEWFTAAAGPELPFGTRIYIPYFRNHENNGIFVVEDRGGAIKNNCIDIYIPDQKTVDDFGVKWLDVHILKE